VWAAGRASNLCRTVPYIPQIFLFWKVCHPGLHCYTHESCIVTSEWLVCDHCYCCCRVHLHECKWYVFSHSVAVSSLRSAQQRLVSGYPVIFIALIYIYLSVQWCGCVGHCISCSFQLFCKNLRFFFFFFFFFFVTLCS